MYVPLNVHSQYSILDSTISCQQLAERAKSFGISSLAITDRGNLYGAVDFFKACKSSGIKPLIGFQIWVAPASRFEKKRNPNSPGFPILLLAKNRTGYRNLCQLSSHGFIEGFYYEPRIDRELLAQHAEGLICLSRSADRSDVLWFQEHFKDDFYFEIQRHAKSEETKEAWLMQKMQDLAKDEAALNESLLALSKELGIRAAASNEIHYLEHEDWQAHEVLLNILSGQPCEIWTLDSMGAAKSRIPNPKREALASHELYFKSPEQMAALFSDIPETLEETLRIAEKCDLELDFKTKHYPVFVPPDLVGKSFTSEERIKAAEKTLYDLCQEGISKRYTEVRLAEIKKKVACEDPLQAVRDRFDYEFHILSSKGMCDYFLIVSDFINWAKNRGIPIGPGRGSAAGSLISYLMGITDIEPLRFHLFFERFLNPERISYPDIDVDICMERRQEVIDYAVQKYGKEKVAQIITFGTMKAKMALRDVGRVLNVPLVKVNELAKLVPEDPNMTLEKALQLDPELNRRIEQDEEVKRLFTMAKKCEGSIRNTSTHAAGLIISERSIADLIPVCTAKDSSMLVTQFAMKPVESVGMLKIDCLGLKTLTCIQKCVEAIKVRSGITIQWNDLPLNDAKTFELINQGHTLGIFQIETGGMQDLARQLRVDCFEEIIAVCALFRPGPMDMIPSFINRKHGREPIEIEHPLMKDILSETYGLMVYQEQVMQIASMLAGYSLGEGDVLRRAMGKKDKEEMARQREKFTSGCVERAIPREVATVIFDKMEKFASYGFNKSHAAAYAYITYITAYLKAHYPKEWMAALMTCDRTDLGHVAKFIREAHSMHIALLPPDINTAGSDFVATEEGIRFALSGIKGVGTGVVEQILEERAKNGPFTCLYNFIQRLCGKAGKKQVELLIEAGCFDFTSWSRDAMRESVAEMTEEVSVAHREASSGVMNLFALIEEPRARFQDPPPVLSPSTKLNLLQREKELLGFYLTGHPMESHQKTIALLGCKPFSEFENQPQGTLVRAAFLIETVQIKISSKSQKKFAILMISDGLERFELPIWPELYEEKGSLLRENQILYGIIQLERREGILSLQARFIDDLTLIDEAKIKALYDQFDKLAARPNASSFRSKQAAATQKPNREEPVAQLLRLRVDADRTRLSHILALKKVLRAHPGNSPVEIDYFGQGKLLGTLQINPPWGIQLTAQLKEDLQSLGVFQPH